MSEGFSLFQSVGVLTLHSRDVGKEGVGFKAGSRPDCNHHRQNRQNLSWVPLGPVFSRTSKRRARCSQEPPQNRHSRQNRHEGYPRGYSTPFRGFEKGGFQKGSFGGCSQKPERRCIRMFPGTTNRNEGTRGCSPVPKTGMRAHSPKLGCTPKGSYGNTAF